MPIDVAAPFERLMNACNDKDLSWWPLVHCRPLSTERFGRRAVAAMAVVTAVWIVVFAAIVPAAFVAALAVIYHHPPIVTAYNYGRAVRWFEMIGLLDAVLCAAAIGWPLSIAWSAWAWNRRTRRLSMAVTSTAVDVDVDEAVWPPPPR